MEAAKQPDLQCNTSDIPSTEAYPETETENNDDDHPSSNNQPDPGPSEPQPRNEIRNHWCPFHKKLVAHKLEDCFLRNNRHRKNTKSSPGPAAKNTSLPTVPPVDDRMKRYNALWEGQEPPIPSPEPMQVTVLSFNDWMIAANSPAHMTPYQSVFTTFREHHRPISTADGRETWTEGYGDVVLNVGDVNNSQLHGVITLHEVWLVPDLIHNLLSVNALTTDGFAIRYGRDKLTLLKSDPSMPHGAGKDVAYGLDHGGQNWLNCLGISLSVLDTLLDANMVSISSREQSQSIVPFNLAHRRACHASQDRIQQLDFTSMGISVLNAGGANFSCDSCFGRQYRASTQCERRLVTRPGDLLHINLWGPIPIPGIGGEAYFMAMTDEASRACWISVLKAKCEVTECVIRVETTIERETGINIKQYRSDDGPEYSTLANHCASRGIIWSPRPGSMNQYKGFVDFENRHLMKPVVTILLENKLPKLLWSWLIRGVNHTMNRLFHPAIGMTPHEAFYGRKPDTSHLRTLGCQCWYLVPEAERNPKFDSGVAEGRLVAYDFDGTYAIWDVQSEKIVHSRKVVFNENSTPTILPEPSRDPEIQSWPEAASPQQRMVNNLGSIEFLTMALSSHHSWGDGPYVGALHFV